MKLKITKIKIRRILYVIILFTVVFWLLKQYQSFIKIKSADQLNSRVSKLIPQINQLTVNYLDGKDILQKKVNTLNCENFKSCIKIKNDNNVWLSAANSEMATPLDKYYLVKLVIKNDGGTSGINFIGGFPESKKDWWDGLIQFSTYLDNDKLKINLNDGTSQIPQVLYYEPIQIDDFSYAHIYLLFDNKGKNVTIYDKKGKQISKFDIINKTKNKLKDGIFPDNNIFVGISVAPNSSLDIAEFYGFDASFIKL